MSCAVDAHLHASESALILNELYCTSIGIWYKSNVIIGYFVISVLHSLQQLLVIVALVFVVHDMQSFFLLIQSTAILTGSQVRVLRAITRYFQVQQL
jgi:hypothetical protein